MLMDITTGKAIRRRLRSQIQQAFYVSCFSLACPGKSLFRLEGYHSVEGRCGKSQAQLVDVAAARLADAGLIAMVRAISSILFRHEQQGRLDAAVSAFDGLRDRRSPQGPTGCRSDHSIKLNPHSRVCWVQCWPREGTVHAGRKRRIYQTIPCI